MDKIVGRARIKEGEQVVPLGRVATWYSSCGCQRWREERQLGRWVVLDGHLGASIVCHLVDEVEQLLALMASAHHS
jgi:hypothetical protein